MRRNPYRLKEVATSAMVIIDLNRVDGIIQESEDRVAFLISGQIRLFRLIDSGPSIESRGFENLIEQWMASGPRSVFVDFYTKDNRDEEGWGTRFTVDLRSVEALFPRPGNMFFTDSVSIIYEGGKDRLFWVKLADGLSYEEYFRDLEKRWHRARGFCDQTTELHKD